MTPRNGQTVRQDRPELRLDLDGGKIVSQTTTRVQGDEGHIHLHVDGKLVDMNYGLRQRLPQLPPGQHVVQVEFVAADHAPFDPRVLTQAAFQVADDRPPPPGRRPPPRVDPRVPTRAGA